MTTLPVVSEIDEELQYRSGMKDLRKLDTESESLEEIM